MNSPYVTDFLGLLRVRGEKVYCNHFYLLILFSWESMW